MNASERTHFYVVPLLANDQATYRPRNHTPLTLADVLIGFAFGCAFGFLGGYMLGLWRG